MQLLWHQTISVCKKHWSRQCYQKQRFQSVNPTCKRLGRLLISTNLNAKKTRHCALSCFRCCSLKGKPDRGRAWGIGDFPASLGVPLLCMLISVTMFGPPPYQCNHHGMEVNLDTHLFFLKMRKKQK